MRPWDSSGGRSVPVPKIWGLHRTCRGRAGSRWPVKEIVTQTRDVKQAGLIFMRLKVRRAVKEQLRRRSSVTLRITETFAPEGGSPATESRRVRFN